MLGSEERWVRRRSKPPHPPGRGRACRIGLLALLLWQACQAEEIVPFRLTGIEGHVLVDYLFDGLSTGQTGVPAATSEQKQTSLREEIFVMSHSYVYHPNFLTLDIGGGPVRQDTSIDVDGTETSVGKTLYNFTGRASLLRDKPMSGSLFYDHLNPTVSVAPGEIMVQESDRYGLNFSVSNAALGLPFNLGYVRTQTQGSGAGRVLDDDLEQFNFNISRSFGKLGSTSLQYQAADQRSRSGSLSLPIQATTTASQGLNLNTRLQFGDNQQYDLSNHISFNRRQYTLASASQPDQSDSGFLLDLRARPSRQLSLFGAYHRNSNDQGLNSLVAQSLSGGASYLPQPDLETSVGIRLDRSDADQYALRSESIDGAIRYKHALWLGNLQLSYGAKYDRRDQQASNPLVNVIDESVTLAGTSQVALSNLHVVAGSVVVTNLTQTQTYVENLDYLVIVIGAETRLQRLASGSILDGEVVLVDYTYDIGGSYASTQLDQTLSLNWNVSRNVDAYFRWFDSSPELTSGVATFQLNEVRSVLLGVRAETPLSSGFSVGGSYELEDRRETISPYRREAGDLFLQTMEPLFGLANLRLTGRRNRIVYDYSTQDVDLTGYELRLWTRRFGIDLTALLGYEEDLGGPSTRSRRDASLNAVWRERKVTVTAALVHSHELQGDYARDHTLFRLTARRDF
jgi:hypothetical protein